MDDFTSKPGVPNLYGLVQGEANAIAPKKTPLGREARRPLREACDGSVDKGLAHEPASGHLPARAQHLLPHRRQRGRPQARPALESRPVGQLLRRWTNAGEDSRIVSKSAGIIRGFRAKRGASETFHAARATVRRLLVRLSRGGGSPSLSAQLVHNAVTLTVLARNYD